MIVAINKLDNVTFSYLLFLSFELLKKQKKNKKVKWSEERFTEIINKILPFLKQSGFKEQNIFFVPCSGLKGENIIERTAPELSWYKGPTLVGAIGTFYIIHFIYCENFDNPINLNCKFKS